MLLASFTNGRIEEMAPNSEVLDICRKTGLSAKAVTNLMSSGQIYLEGFLYRHYEYEFLFNDVDAEASISMASFWSDLLESRMFSSLPEAWAEMACVLQLYKAICDEEESLKGKNWSCHLVRNFMTLLTSIMQHIDMIRVLEWTHMKYTTMTAVEL